MNYQKERIKKLKLIKYLIYYLKILRKIKQLVIKILI